ncbi:family 43 glycosylhydrolase [Formosa sp. PL04]|uniref:family 43 glycosylhydrolase n=1 Tax=Formosa sp. PL04 TaxID=3081755 RepID=UPI0029815575|nr:family 43 glycosylhydrolase [Formosa sp. PL04]MDW5288133.1 family 43 glycosylhydrolase [Formosa sp. PL04]
MKLFLFLLLSTFCFQFVFSQNPITKVNGVSDPHIRVFKDTVYLFTGHDTSPKDKLWDMRDWRVFKTTNLLDWTQIETISPKDNYMSDSSGDCWASDAATRNGKYYFYFSDQKRGIGVMSANTPDGPYSDALGVPLVAPLHDPTIFMDDDKLKTPYIIYGDKSDSYYVAKLNENMISIAETPKKITINGEAWEKAPKWMDKNYLFKHNDTYYLSWGRDYAISKNIYGPFESVGAVGKGHQLDQFAHGSFFNWKGQFYHVWCYYLKNGFKYRETIMTYCHMDDNGKIVTDTAFLDQHFKNGVGQYNASWDKIEAEWFYEISPDVKKKGTKKDGFVVSNLKDESCVRFANVNFETVSKDLDVFLKNTVGKGKLEIRIDSQTGPIIGEVKLDKTSNGLISIPLQKVLGKKDIYILFAGDHKLQTELDYLKFK